MGDSASGARLAPVDPAIQTLATEEGTAAPVRWYALHVRSRHERVVENSLTEKGFGVLFPFYRAKRKRLDRIVEIDLPLFPGYMFCSLDVTKLLPVLKTPGVVAVIGSANRPEPVEEHEIASIQTFMRCGRPLQPWPFLRIGQRIRIQAGPLAGAEGIFLRTKNECRLIASIPLLQRAIAVEIEQDSVEPIF